MAFAWAGIELFGDPVALTLRDCLERRAFREVLTKQPVEVLVGSPLPGVVRSREVELHAEAALELLVVVELRAVIERQRTELATQPAHDPGRRRRRFLGGARPELTNHRETAPTLHEGQDAPTRVHGTHHRIAFPIADAATPFDDDR